MACALVILLVPAICAFCGSRRTVVFTRLPAYPFRPLSRMQLLIAMFFSSAPASWFPDFSDAPREINVVGLPPRLHRMPEKETLAPMTWHFL